jgi:1-acyl-sn-glycerol-3-phosphate acyltransferase
MTKTGKVREQQVPMESVYPLHISKDYVFIRTDLWYRFYSGITYFVFGMVLGIGFFRIINRHKVQGKEHLKKLKGQGFISVANHCHIFDTVLTGMALRPRDLWFASVQRNFEAPYYRKMFRILRGFPIPDGVFGLRQILKPVVTAVKSGKGVHFFPEAELWHLYQGIDHFQRGAFYLAHQANAPVLPLVHLFKPRTFFGKQISKNILSITTVIGKPIYPKVPVGSDGHADLESVSEMADQIKQWMKDEMEKYHDNQQAS